MAIEPEELKRITEGVLSKHRREVVDLVSMFNTVLMATTPFPTLQLLTMFTLKECINARMREMHGSMAEFEACANAMAQAGATIRNIDAVPD